MNAVPGRLATHKHRSVGPDRRVWLEALPHEAASMRLHAYCADCGAVRSELPIHGRPLGYFAQALANLKALLEHNPKYAELAQVQSHLIMMALRSVPNFGDPYSMPFETQWLLFLAAVQRICPELDVDLVQAALPRESRRRRVAYIDLIARKEGGL